MTWAASGGNTVTWTGSVGDWSGLTSTIITGSTNAGAYVGTGGGGVSSAKIIALAAGITSVVINGVFDDTDWIVYLPNNCKISYGASCVWTSGRDVNGYAEGGSVLIHTNTGSSWGAGANITPGAQLNWYGSRLYFAGSGFGVLRENTASASAKNHVLKNVRLYAGQTLYGWCIIDIKTTPESYIVGERINFTAGSSAVKIPTFRSWNGQGGVSFLPLDGAITTTEFFSLNANLASGEKLTLANHGGPTKTATYKLYNPVVDIASIRIASNALAQTQTERYIYCSGSLKVIDPTGAGVDASSVVITNLRTNGNTQTGATNSSGILTIPNTQVQYGIWANGATATGIENVTPTITDDSSQKIIVRAANRIESAQSYTWTGAALALQLTQSIDSDFTGTVAEAAAITGVSFTVGAGAVTVNVSTSMTAQQVYNAWKHWTSQTAQMTGASPVNQGLITLVSGNLSITGSIDVSATLTAGGNVTVGVVCTGTASTSGDGVYSCVVEDSAGVRVTVSKSGGGVFNIAARKGTTGSYVSLPYQSGVSTVTYSVPKGTPLEVVAWSLGYVTYSKLITTTGGGSSLSMEMIANPAINTALDVSSYLANITTSIDTVLGYPCFVATINAPMVVPGIEEGKAILHALVSSDLALSASFPPGSTSILAINADEITVHKPAIRIEVGAAVTVSQRVYLDFFFNTTAALALNPSWVLNPVRADGNQVQVLRSKPTLDASYLASQVVSSLEASTVLAKEATSAAIKTKTDALTFTQSGVVDANIQYVNDVQVKGTGTDSDPWSPE